MYHEIADGSETNSRLAVTPTDFADQLAYLHDMGWRTISAIELSAILAAGAAISLEKTVVLSFDDGYEDFYTRAMPLLSRYNFTATLFMTSGLVKEASPHRPGLPRMLSWAQLSDLSRFGIEIGAHSLTHPELDQLTDKRLREELFTSKKQLEDKLGIEVPGLAYPYGYSNSAVHEIAQEAGYSYGYAVSNRMVTSKAEIFTIPRLTIKQTTKLDEFHRLVNGVDTAGLRRARILSNGWAMVRGTRRTIREVQARLPVDGRPHVRKAPQGESKQMTE